MTESLLQLDTEIFLFLNSFHTIFWDVVMKMASGKAVWGVFYLSMLFALGRTYGWRSMIAITLMAIVAVVAADQITASLLRPIFERPRPANPDSPIAELVHIVNGYRGGKYGFPSCHAANTFATATLLSLVFGRWRFALFMFLWALLNCYSRIYLGVHYPGDLLAGFLVGCFCGAVVFMLGSMVAGKMTMHRLPESQSLIKIITYKRELVSFRPLDVAIWTGLLTMIFIVLCASAIF